MRKPLEMYVASRMQNMVQIRAQNACFATKLHIFVFAIILLGFSALRAPTVGPFVGIFAKLFSIQYLDNFYSLSKGNLKGPGGVDRDLGL